MDGAAVGSLSRQDRLRKSFLAGTLKVRSVSMVGDVEWQRIEAVHKADVGTESIWEVETKFGRSIFTGGHRVYTSPRAAVDAETLKEGDLVLVVDQDHPYRTPVTSVKRSPSRVHMYDLTVAVNHNLVLRKSRIAGHNSPDRNYHFRPPTHENTINNYNRVFGYVWEDAELVECLERGLDMIAAAPPATPFQNCTQLIQCYPHWRTLLLNGAMLHALFMLQLNWIVDEFSLAGDSEVRVRLPDGRELDVSLRELHRICRGE